MKPHQLNDKTLMWADPNEVEFAALNQIRNISELPWVYGVRVMPDVHLGDRNAARSPTNRSARGGVGCRDINVNIVVGISITLAFSLAANIVMWVRGRQRVREINRQRERADRLETDQGIPVPKRKEK